MKHFLVVHGYLPFGYEGCWRTPNYRTYCRTLDYNGKIFDNCELIDARYYVPICDENSQQKGVNLNI